MLIDLMLIDIAAGLFLARRFSLSLGFGAPMQQTVCSSLPLVEFPPDPLARFSKIDDVTHLVPLVPAG
jgi:hypothetical protein